MALLPFLSSSSSSSYKRRRSAAPGRASAPHSTDLSPLRLATQIVLLQSAYYAAATALILFTALVAGSSFSMALILDWRTVRGDTAVGWTLGLCWLMCSVFGSLFILLLISRSKLVPDFALTLHGIHLLISTLYTRALPRHLLWWALQGASAATMIGLGTWACQWRELRPLSFGGSASTATGATTSSASYSALHPTDSHDPMLHSDRLSSDISNATELNTISHKAKTTPALPPPDFALDLQAGGSSVNAASAAGLLRSASGVNNGRRNSGASGIGSSRTSAEANIT